jgi:hypothetical protein
LLGNCLETSPELTYWLHWGQLPSLQCKDACCQGLRRLGKQGHQWYDVCCKGLRTLGKQGHQWYDVCCQGLQRVVKQLFNSLPRKKQLFNLTFFPIICKQISVIYKALYVFFLLVKSIYKYIYILIEIISCSLIIVKKLFSHMGDVLKKKNALSKFELQKSGYMRSN